MNTAQQLNGGYPNKQVPLNFGGFSLKRGGFFGALIIAAWCLVAPSALAITYTWVNDIPNSPTNFFAAQFETPIPAVLDGQIDAAEITSFSAQTSSRLFTALESGAYTLNGIDEVIGGVLRAHTTLVEAGFLFNSVFTITATTWTLEISPERFPLSIVRTTGTGHWEKPGLASPVPDSTSGGAALFFAFSGLVVARRWGVIPL